MTNMKDPGDQADLDNHADQLNPNNEEYAGSGNDDDHDYDNDNHADQLNPNNDEYQGG
jgi:hypothetical protein